MLGDLEGAHALLTETLAVARRANSPAGISGGLTGLGSLAARRGDHQGAYELYLEGLAVRRKGSDRALTDQLNALGRAALGMGDPILAAAHFRESLEMCRAQGMQWDAAFAIAGLAEVAMGTGDMHRATRLFAASDALLAALGERRSAIDQAEHEQKLQAVSDALGEAAFKQPSAGGRLITRDEAIAIALQE